MSNTKANRKQNAFIFLLFLVFSFGILYICTASSPRYAINPWNDANAFLTVGRAMANGKIVYKDIFEQKGPLLYLIHALASLISDNSFSGVYVLQSLSLSVFAFSAYKISSLYISRGWSITAAILTCFFTVNTTCYYYGDSAEEFCLPLLSISIYFFCKYFMDTDKQKISKPVFFIVGFFAGCVAMIKFTLIGFWFAWAAYISLHTWIAKKNFKKAFVDAFIFLAGMAAAIAPWVIYFAANGALSDFINVYFVLNTTAYSNADNLSLFAYIKEFVYILGVNFVFLPCISFLSIFGMFSFAFRNFFAEKKLFSRLSVPCVFAFGLFVIYAGLKDYSYYMIPISAFAVFSFIVLFRFVEKHSKSGAKKLPQIITCCVLLVVTIVTSNFVNISSRTAVRNKANSLTYKAAEYIKEKNPDGKVLNYRGLDSGIYLATEQIPAFRHFEKQNFPYEQFSENRDEQNRYINEHEADFVVVCISKRTIDGDEIYDENPTLKTDYNLVFHEHFEVGHSLNPFKSTEMSYYLFELAEK